MQNTAKQLNYALIAFVIFCALSWAAQSIPPLFSLVTMLGLAFPLIWGKFTGEWAPMGFTKDNLKPALAWGLLGGILTGLIGIAVIPQRTLPDQLALQLLIGVPVWALVASPFQEFFFRGWLQPRFVNRLGEVGGLLAANTAFTLWHYAAPFVGRTLVPLDTVIGALSTFAAGLVYTLVFHRTRSIIAPWLAHVVAGVMFILIGAMDFTQLSF